VGAICIGFYAKLVANFRTINKASTNAASPWQNASETQRQPVCNSNSKNSNSNNDHEAFGAKMQLLQIM